MIVKKKSRNLSLEIAIYLWKSMRPPRSTSLHAEATTVAAGPLITFLVASSLISIHPSTCVIDITLASLPTDFPVIVALGKLQTNTNDTDAGRSPSMKP